MVKVDELVSGMSWTLGRKLRRPKTSTILTALSSFITGVGSAKWSADGFPEDELERPSRPLRGAEVYFSCREHDRLGSADA
jgi:hypothetical protein